MELSNIWTRRSDTLAAHVTSEECSHYEADSEYDLGFGSSVFGGRECAKGW